LAAQIRLEEKKAQATWVIDNSGTPDETRVQVERLWRILTARAGEQL
jgi:dephospho-CoA kinase